MSEEIDGRRRVVVLVDGEHHAPVIESALDSLRRDGAEVVAAVFLGGSEKAEHLPELSCPLRSGRIPAILLREAIADLSPDVVVDLSDSPVVDSFARAELASHTLSLGVRYEGTDFAFDPPPGPRIARRPSARIIGSGKRAGKTAVSGEFTRYLDRSGEKPVVVAMGRGGPGEPEVIWPSDVSLGVRSLIEMADTGRHAASDHIEDAVTTGALTIGTRRCGGGVAGAPGPNNFADGVAIANDLADGEDLTFMVFEGSGAAIPPVAADSSLLVAASGGDLATLGGYLGIYRVLVSDAVIVMSGTGKGRRGPFELAEEIRDAFPEKMVTVAELVPHPLTSVEGMRVSVATTAHRSANESIERSLKEVHGAEVTGITNYLSSRGPLVSDLKSILVDAEILLTEVKAAGVDIAARHAREIGIPVTFLDNRPVPAGGEPPLDEVFDLVRSLAIGRFESG